MLPQLMSLVSERLAGCSLGVALAGALAGAALWLAGARFSRSLITLIAVAIGTSIGMRLPRWCGWNIDGMAIAIGGAMVLGVSGYLLHRTWVGIYLGLLFALWAATGAWLLTGAGEPLPMPAWTDLTSPASLANSWSALPPVAAHVFAVSVLGGFSTGILFAILWPRLSRVLAWSLLGTTMLLIAFLMLASTTHPSWVATLSPTNGSQPALLAAIVVIGAAIQWCLLPPDARPTHREAAQTPSPASTILPPRAAI